MNIATNIGAIRINLFVIDELNSSGNDQLKDTTYENYCTNDKCNGDPAQVSDWCLQQFNEIIASFINILNEENAKAIDEYFMIWINYKLKNI